MTIFGAPYRKAHGRDIRLKLAHDSGVMLVDLTAALDSLLKSFDAPMPPNGRPLDNGNVLIVNTGEEITRKEMNRRYLILIIQNMGEQ